MLNADFAHAQIARLPIRPIALHLEKADRIVVLDGGHVVAAAPTEELRKNTHPRIQQFLNRVPDSDEGEEVDRFELFTERL